MSKPYRVTILFDNQDKTADIKKIIEQFSADFDNKFQTKTQILGSGYQKLSYPIKSVLDAQLVDLIFNLEPEKLHTAELYLSKQPIIIRHLILKDIAPDKTAARKPKVTSKPTKIKTEVKIAPTKASQKIEAKSTPAKIDEVVVPKPTPPKKVAAPKVTVETKISEPKIKPSKQMAKESPATKLPTESKIKQELEDEEDRMKKLDDKLDELLKE